MVVHWAACGNGIITSAQYLMRQLKVAKIFTHRIIMRDGRSLVDLTEEGIVVKAG